MAGRLRRLRRYGAHWRDAWPVARMFAWSLVLPGLKSSVSLERLVRGLWVGPSSADRQPERERHVTRLVTFVNRAVTRTILESGNCLEQGLLLYRSLSASGADPILMIGVRKSEGELKGHAWVVVDGAPVGEPTESVREYSPVMAFGARGPRVELMASGEDLPPLWR